MHMSLNNIVHEMHIAVLNWNYQYYHLSKILWKAGHYVDIINIAKKHLQHCCTIPLFAKYEKVQKVLCFVVL